MIELKNIKKSYGKNVVLKDVNLTINEGDFLIILGKSGEGKTTLLNILSTIDTSNVEGEFLFDKKDILKMSDKERTKFRGKNIGYIFQDFRLIDEFNVLDNVMLSGYINKMDKNKLKEKAKKLLKELDIEQKHFLKKPYELSGGQQQRVAIARALIHSPKIIFADEPTGNLDEKSALRVIDIFKELSKKVTLVVVTHNFEIFEKIDKKRVVKLKNGSLNEYSS